MHAASTYRGSTTLSFSSPCYALRLWHFEFKTLLMFSSAFSKRPKKFVVPDHPTGHTCRIGTSKLILEPRKFCILRIFKPPFKRMGSYKFCQSLFSRNSCWVPDSGIMPKWVLPSSLLTGWRMQSMRKGSCPTGLSFCTYLWLMLSRPRKNLNYSRSSFQMRHTSVSLFTPGGTTRNTLRTLLQSF